MKELLNKIRNYIKQKRLISLFEEEFGKISPDGSVNGGLFLEGYEYPLPNSIINFTGYLWVRTYKYPLPNSIVNINGGYLNLRGYKHPLPNSIVNVGGNIWLNNSQKLPKNLNINNVKKIKYNI